MHSLLSPHIEWWESFLSIRMREVRHGWDWRIVAVLLVLGLVGISTVQAAPDAEEKVGRMGWSNVDALRTEPGGVGEEVSPLNFDLKGLSSKTDIGRSFLTPAADTICVDASVGTVGTGSCWAEPFRDLQDALAQAQAGDSIWVAGGVYYPDEGAGVTNGRRDTSFVLKDSIKVFGGFSGNETSLSGRDVEANRTILSGDIDKDDSDPDGDGLIQVADTTGGNSYHVLRTSNYPSRLDGFYVTAGDASGSTFSTARGGGLYVPNQSGLDPVLTLANTRFVGNYAIQDGGGIYVTDADLVLSNVEFIGNQAETSGGGIFLAGSDYGSLWMANVVFSGNVAVTQSGGGFYHLGYNPVLHNVTFSNNEAAANGGGVYIDSTAGPMEVRNTTLWGNNAANTGNQIYNDGSLALGPVVLEGDTSGIAGGGSLFASRILDADPLFIAPPGSDGIAGTADDDLRLNWASPAIDLGSGTPVDSADVDNDGNRSESLPEDLLGQPRHRGFTVDVGAFEGGAEPSGTRVVYADSAAGTDAGGSGGSWGTPYRTLQAALSAAHNAKAASSGVPFEEVWVAEGTYYPNDGPGFKVGGPSGSFSLPNNVAVYGGFQNGESFSQRNPDPATNGTVLSGDIGVSSDTSDNSYNVVLAGGRVNSLTFLIEEANYILEPLSPSTVLDGFTISGGNARVPDREVGGGVFLTGSAGEETSPTLRNLRVMGNYAKSGAGLMVSVGSGGIAHPRLSRVDFIGNEADQIAGGALFGTTGGATGPQIANARFLGNRAKGAAAFGAFADSSGTTEPEMANVLFSGNETASGNAAVLLRNGVNSTLSPTLVNTTWASNSASSDSLDALVKVEGESGGVDVQVANSILWSNAADSLAGGLAGTVTIQSSVVEGGWSGTGADNVDADPRYLDPVGSDGTAGTPDDSLQVLGNSPALAHGDETFLPPDVTDLDVDGDTSEVLPQDLAGASRVLTRAVEAGAYEGAASPSVAVKEATNVTSSSAALSGDVVPYASSAGVSFEYWPSGADTSHVVSLGAVSGTDSVGVDTTIQDLQSGVEYRYQLKADDGIRSTTSSTKTFLTQSGEATLTADVDSADFGRAQVGTVGPDTSVTFTNTGGTSATGLSLALEGDGDFSVLVDTGEETLEPGSTRTVQVALSPGTSGTGRSATLSLTSDEGALAEVPLTGDGVDAAVDVGEAIRGQSVNVAFTPEGPFQPVRGELFVRRGGEGFDQYLQLPLQIDESSGQVRFVATVHDSLVTERGVDYFASLAEESGFSVVVPGGSFEEALVRPFHLPVQFEGLQPPFDMEAKSYQMVSVPARMQGGLRQAFEESYGSYDPGVWRLLQWGGQEGYREFPKIDSLGPGQGMWLINSEGKNFSLGQGQTVEAETSYEIELAPGWNQIGVPFGFAVPWAVVQDSTEAAPGQIGSPVVYRDSTYRYLDPQTAVLEPWEGYFVFNDASEPVELVIPPFGVEEFATGTTKALPGSEGALPKGRENVLADFCTRTEKCAQATRAPHLESKRDGAKASASAEEQASGEGTYTLQIEAQPAGRRSRQVGQRVWLGLRPEARVERDTIDFAQAPPLGQGIRVSLLEKQNENGQSQNGTTSGGTRYAGSFKPGDKEGEVWELLVENRSSGTFRRSVTAHLRLQEAGTLPQGFNRYVFDVERGRRLPDGGTSLTLDAGEKRRMKVVVGTENYAKKESDGIPLKRYEERLHGNAPNPFSRKTTIEFALSERKKVTLEIYNVLGQRVRRLVRGEEKEAGLHAVRWDGRNDLGREVGSGMYFYRIEAGDFTDTRKMVLVR